MSFKTPEQIETLTGVKMIPLQFSNLRAHITKHIGLNKKYDAVVMEKLPQKKHTFSNTTDFIKISPKAPAP